MRRADLVDHLHVERADAVKVHRPPGLIHLVGVEGVGWKGGGGGEGEGGGEGGGEGEGEGAGEGEGEGAGEGEGSAGVSTLWWLKG